MTIGLAPTFDIGPASVAWHGLMTALGLVVAIFLAERIAGHRGLEQGVLTSMAVVAALAGVVGARLFFLAQEDPGRLARPWSGGTTGFAFYGSVLAALPALALYLRATHRPVLVHLDVAAITFPVGMAIGRVGDLINGEHFGPPAAVPWGVTYTDPAAHVPTTGVAYHSGALYEIVGVLLIAGVVWGLHRRLSRPGDALWLVVGAYGLVRFVVFFWVRDVEVVGLGLRQAQWTSLGFVLFAGGAALTSRLWSRQATRSA